MKEAMREQKIFFGMAVFAIVGFAAVEYLARWHQLSQEHVSKSDPRYRQLGYSILLAIVAVLVAMSRMHLL